MLDASTKSFPVSVKPVKRTSKEGNAPNENIQIGKVYVLQLGRLA
jgi:hypothetical protein